MDPELIVKFKGDLSDWDSAIKKVKGDLNTINVDFGKAAPAVDRFDKQINNAGGSLGNFLKGYLALDTVMRAGAAFITATKDVQKFENQLKVASGTQQDYAKNTQFLEGLAARYNKNVLDLGANFAQLTIATRGTNMEGEKTERLFAAVTATSAALQMSVDDTNGTFRAFIQMVSKGNVQAEELRGQLGERLYGAFNLAAKSMGVTTQELNKMLEQGQVLASDLLPKLTTELENTFGADAEANAKNLGSAIDYATGQLTMMFAELGKSTGFTDMLTNVATKLGEIASKARELNEITPKKRSVLDMMFTLPGGSTEGFSNLEAFGKLVYAYNNPTGRGESDKMPGNPSISDATSNVLSDTYGAQFDIRETDHKKETRLKKEAEAASKRADAEITRWANEQIRLSNERIAKALSDAKIEQQMHYANRPVSTGGMMGATGTKRVYGEDLKSVTTEFTNQLGPSTTALERMGHIIDQINSMDGIYWKDKLNADRLKNEQRSIQESAEKIQESVNDQLNSAFGQAARDIPVAMGMMVASLAQGGDGMQDVGNVFFQIASDLFQRVGEALLTATGIFKAAQVSLTSMNPVVAGAGALIAFSAAALLRNQIKQSGSEARGRFFSGGIVPGPVGVDRVPVNVSAGEMILNSRHQRNLFGLIDGTATGRGLEFTGRKDATRDTLVLSATLKGSDIDISGKQGSKKNARFR